MCRAEKKKETFVSGQNDQEETITNLKNLPFKIVKVGAENIYI